MPAARARTCATREASRRPGSSAITGTAPIFTVTTPTGMAGTPPAPAAGAAAPDLALSSPPQAARNRAAAAHTANKRAEDRTEGEGETIRDTSFEFLPGQLTTSLYIHSRTYVLV